MMMIKFDKEQYKTITMMIKTNDETQQNNSDNKRRRNIILHKQSKTTKWLTYYKQHNSTSEKDININLKNLRF